MQSWLRVIKSPPSVSAERRPILCTTGREFRVLRVNPLLKQAFSLLSQRAGANLSCWVIHPRWGEMGSLIGRWCRYFGQVTPLSKSALGNPVRIGASEKAELEKVMD